MLKIEQLSGGYEANTPTVQNISFSVEKGQMIGILGPNGCGKSTLLKCITGAIKPFAGKVEIDQQLITSYRPKDLAKKMAVLPQLHANAFSNIVREAVALGRYPYQSGLFSSWSAKDEEAVQWAMAQTDVAKFANQPLALLSGGEQQRVFIAQALAQQAQLILLDEPTNHLDIAQQVQILDTLKQQTVNQQATIVSVFHDINLAALYCDTLIMMKEGRIIQIGKPHEVVTAQRIGEVYEANVLTNAHPEIEKPQILLKPREPIQRFHVSEEQLHVTDDFIVLQHKTPLKVVSSAVYNAGMGWYSTLINRSVSPNYRVQNVEAEVAQFIVDQHFIPTDTVVMLTAVPARAMIVKTRQFEGGDLIVCVTAGIGNAVDVSQTYKRDDQPQVGTINIWCIINGHLSEEAFYQGMITATEAKTRALYEESVIDLYTGTIATGTPTDSLLIGATQHGTTIRYAGPITEVGKAIGKTVYDAVLQAIQTLKEEN